MIDKRERTIKKAFHSENLWKKIIGFTEIVHEN